MQRVEVQAMASDPDADPAIVRRLRDALPSRLASAREAMTREAMTRDATRAAARDDRVAPARDGLEEDVAAAIRSIERVVGNFGALKDRFQSYKDLVGELHAELDAEQALGEELEREFAALERTLKADQERALRAEEQARRSDGTVRDLEQQLALLQAQASRLVKAISMLTSAEIDVRDDGDDVPRLTTRRDASTDGGR